MKLEAIIFTTPPRRGVLSLGKTTVAWILFEEPQHTPIRRLRFRNVLAKKGWKLKWGKDE